MGNSSSFVKSKAVDKKNTDEAPGIKVGLYIGVFFDGTNNNKLQAMIGQGFSRKKIFDSHKQDFKKNGYDNINQLLAKTRDEAEKELGKVLTRSEFDVLYGSSLVGHKSIDSQVVNDGDEYRWSSTNVNTEEGNALSRRGKKSLANKMNELNEDTSEKSFWAKSHLPDFSIKGSLSQGSTYTNPAILSSLYITGEQKESQNNEEDKQYHYALYVEGSGADATTNLVDSVSGAASDVIGLGFGVGHTGISMKCRRIVDQVNRIYEKHYVEDDVKEIYFHFDVFGFSRGAATARLFTYVVNVNNDDIPSQDYELFTGKNKMFLPLKGPENTMSKIVAKEVRMLGIYDTVASVGILRDTLNEVVAHTIKLPGYDEFEKYHKSKYHDSNVDDFGLYSTNSAKDVLHICAMDECRINFSLTDIQSSIESNGTELFLPGCHTDIGGGAGLGRDNLKVISKQVISNKNELIPDVVERVYNIKRGIVSVKDVLNSSKQIAEGIKKISGGVEMMGSLLGIPAGLVTIGSGICDAYGGLRDIVSSTNKFAHVLKDATLETTGQVADMYGALDYILGRSDESSASGDSKKVGSQGSSEGSDDTTKSLLTRLAEKTPFDSLQRTGEAYDRLSEKGKAVKKGVTSAVDNAKSSYQKGMSAFQYGLSMDGAVKGFDDAAASLSHALSAIDDINKSVNAVKQTAKGMKGGLESLSSSSPQSSTFSVLGKYSDQIISESNEIIDCFKLTKESLEAIQELGKIGSGSPTPNSGTLPAATKVKDIHDAIEATKDTMKGADNSLNGLSKILGGIDELSKVDLSYKEKTTMVKSVHDVLVGTVDTYKGASKAVTSAADSLKGMKEYIDQLKVQAEKGELDDYGPSDGNAVKGVMDNAGGLVDNAGKIQDSVSKGIEDSQNMVGSFKDLQGLKFNSVSSSLDSVGKLSKSIKNTVSMLGDIQSGADAVNKVCTNMKGLVASVRKGFTVEDGHFVFYNNMKEMVEKKCEEIGETVDTFVDTLTTTKDIIKGKKKPLLPEIKKKEVFFYNRYPCVNITDASTLLPVEISSMQELGWVDAMTVETKDKTFTGRAKNDDLSKGKTVVINGTKAGGVTEFENIGIYKYVYPGYSNISLQLMWDWCNQKNLVFNPVSSAEYPIPSDLMSFYNGVKTQCLSRKGRYFCVPDYNEEYRKLRCKYLHFSVNQQLLAVADNYLVNGPSLVELLDRYVITRRIYKGEKESKTGGSNTAPPGCNLYMHEYIGTDGTLVNVPCSVTGVLVTPSNKS